MLFRTESGQVHVMDAYCQHLGANLGCRRHRGRRKHRLPLARLAVAR